MAKLQWQSPPTNLYDRGVSLGVVYFEDDTVSPWVGLINVTLNPSFDANEVFFEGQNVANSQTREETNAEIECYTYPPDIFEKKAKAFIYQTGYGDSFKVHILYNPTFWLDSRSYTTYSDSPEISTFTISLSAIPNQIWGYAPTSYILLDGVDDDGTGSLQAILEELYGTDDRDARYLTPNLMIAISKDPNYNDLEIIDHGDGTLTHRGAPVTLYPDGKFSVDHYRIRIVDSERFASEIF